VPLTVRDNSDPCLTRIPFFASCRPNRVGDPNLDNRSPGNWINKAAFQVQPLGTFGNARRGILFADGTENVDLNFAKVTGITERTSLEFRAEFYNLFNHPQFGVPDLDFSAGNNPNFGRIFSTARFSNAREIQLGLKLYFEIIGKAHSKALTDFEAAEPYLEIAYLPSVTREALQCCTDGFVLSIADSSTLAIAVTA